MHRKSRIARGVPPFGRGPLLVAILVAVLGASAVAEDWTVVGALPLSSHDPVNAHPYGIVVHPDPTTGLAYAALSGQVAPFGEPADQYSGHTIVEFRTDTLGVTRTFEVGFYPTELAIIADGTTLFATTSTASVVHRIDLASGTVTGWPVADSLGNDVAYLSGLALSPDQSELWVSSNGGSFDGSSENVLVLDRATGAVLDRVTVAGGLGRFAVRSDGRVVLPVGFPGDDFTAAPEIRVYDTQPWTLVNTLPLVVDTADFPAPSDVVLSDDGTRAYVTIFGGSAEVFVVDVDTASLLPSLPLPGPDFVQSAIGLAPGGAELIVGDFFAGRLRVLDRLSGAVLEEVPGLLLPNEVRSSGGRLFVTEQGAEQISVVALPGSFRRGDANRDAAVDLADGIAILQYLFAGGSLPCLDAADVDDDGSLLLGDAITLFSYLFSGGPPPSQPFPLPGSDSLLADGLDCGP